jgi:hypothetical protein
MLVGKEHKTDELNYEMTFKTFIIIILCLLKNLRETLDVRALNTLTGSDQCRTATIGRHVGRFGHPVGLSQKPRLQRERLNGQ